MGIFGQSVDQATQSAIEAETNEDTYAPPDLIKHAPGVAKAWINLAGSGSVSIRDSYNVDSITDLGTGLYRITFTEPMANSDYAVLLGSSAFHGTASTRNVNFCEVASYGSSHTAADATFHVAIFGDA